MEEKWVRTQNIQPSEEAPEWDVALTGSNVIEQHTVKLNLILLYKQSSYTEILRRVILSMFETGFVAIHPKAAWHR